MSIRPFRSTWSLGRAYKFRRSFSTQKQHTRGTRRYIFVPVAVGAGTGYAGYQYIYKDQRTAAVWEPAEQDSLCSSLRVYLYTLLPLNLVSRLWGKINDLDLPVWLRSPVLRLYIRVFSCNLNEAAVTDLRYYPNLGEFFRRALKPNCRPVDKTHAVTCPSDGIVLNCGVITRDHVEQIKGVDYTLSRFMGPQNFPHETEVGTRESSLAVKQASLMTHAGGDAVSLPAAKQTALSMPDAVYEDGLKHNPDNCLYQCVIYLAPGDYHRFHSPADWRISYRRHFPGRLLSVNPRVAERVPELFNLNERVLYFGRWQHGFFSMALVGATNVGSVIVYSDKKLLTNSSKNHEKRIDHDFRPGGEVMTFGKGAPFGEFNLGSTIVLVFEAPESFKFTIKPGQKVRYGQAVGS